MAHGKDGFASLVARSDGGEAEEIVFEENGILISIMLRQYFLSLKILGRWRQFTSLHKQWDHVHAQLHQDHKIKTSSHPTDTHFLRRKLGNASDTDGSPAVPRMPVAFDDGGKVKNLCASGDETDGQEMIDSDSDSSVVLPHLEPSRSAHSLTSPTSSTTVDSMSHDESNRLYHVARTYGRRWMDLAGVERGDIEMVDEHDHSEVPSWTRGIAPRVENRIIQLGGSAER